eukprot:1113191-Prymnesium_polylepis.1
MTDAHAAEVAAGLAVAEGALSISACESNRQFLFAQRRENRLLAKSPEQYWHSCPRAQSPAHSKSAPTGCARGTLASSY